MSWSGAIPVATATVVMLGYMGRGGMRRYGPPMGVAAGLLALGLVEVIAVAAAAGGGNGIIPGAAPMFAGCSIAFAIRIRESARQLRARPTRAVAASGGAPTRAVQGGSRPR